MTIPQFITKYNNQPVEVFDKKNKNQCVDLFLAYIRDVLGLGSIIPIGIGPAYDIYNKTHKFTPYSTKHANTPTFIPKRGDVVVWSSKYGSQGHVAIVTEANIDRFKAFSQNDPIGSPCIIKEYSYRNVLGFLTPNNLPKETMADYYKGLDLNNKDSMKVAVDEWYNVSQGKYVKAEIVVQKDKMIENLNVEIRSCNIHKNQALSSIDHLEQEKKVLSQEKDQLQVEHNELKNTSLAQQKEIERLGKTISSLEEELLELQRELAKDVPTDKPIPYKKLYEDEMNKFNEYKALVGREYVKLAHSRIGQYIQLLAFEIL